MKSAYLTRADNVGVYDFDNYHILALFYKVLGNVHPLYRSTLKNIRLLAVTKSSVLQEYGPQHILELIMKDIKSLEEVGFLLCMSRNVCHIMLSRLAFLSSLMGLSITSRALLP